VAAIRVTSLIHSSTTLSNPSDILTNLMNENSIDIEKPR